VNNSIEADRWNSAEMSLISYIEKKLGMSGCMKENCAIHSMVPAFQILFYLTPDTTVRTGDEYVHIP
jgi:hypothetical protein